MATLETQYNNYLKENPDSNYSFDDWQKIVLPERLKIPIIDEKKDLKNSEERSED